MAVYKRDIVDINLETGNIHRSFLNHSIGYMDQKADHFGIRVFRNGEAVNLTGVSVQGIFMPPQGDPIAITSGNIISGNVAEVVLPQVCYNYSGQFCLSIKLVDGTNSVTGTMRIVDGVVDNTHASGTVAPTSAVPTYQEILAVYDDMVETMEDYQEEVEGQNNKINDIKSALNNELKIEYDAVREKGQAVLAMSGIEVFNENGYFDGNGVIQSASSHRVVVIKDTTIRQITIPQFPQAISGLPTVMVKNGSTIVKMYTFAGNTSDNVLEIPDYIFTDIYINWWGGNDTTPWYDSITIETIWNADDIAESLRKGYGFNSWSDYFGRIVTIPFKNVFGLRNGYLNGSAGYQTAGGTHKNMLIPSKYVKSLQISGDSAPGVPYAYYYKNASSAGSSLIGAVQEGEWNAPTPVGTYGGIIGINYFRSTDDSYAEEVTIEFFDEKTISECDPYDHMVQKPLEFNGRTAVFVGDSIAVGHTDGTHVTQNNFVKGFSERVGLTYTNKAVAGALFTSGLNEVKTIPQQVAEITTAPDFLFIEGGVNDWALGAEIRTFKSTIKSLCDYIAEHFPDTNVIWILPIEVARNDSERSATAYTYLQSYRNAEYEGIMEKYRVKYSIADGEKFGFPDKDASSDYIAAMFGDKLHPSELGYNALYVPGLITALQ